MWTVPPEITLLFRSIDLAGVFLNGLIGGTIARQRRFDMVGFGILAIISALGGGILRDVMLMMGRPVAITDRWYLLVAILGAATAWVAHFQGTLWRTVLPFADGLVLGCWAATGTVKALAGDLGPIPALMMGMITAIGGGMIRDVAVGQVPSVFGGNKLYATPALVSAAGVLAAHAAGLGPVWLMMIGTSLGVVLTTVAHFRDWRLPQHDDTMTMLSAAQVRALVRRSARLARRGESAESSPGPGAHDQTH